MKADRAEQIFTIVFTSCWLAVEFIADLSWWSQEVKVLWWLLLPAAGVVTLFLFMRRSNP